jgi:hypothetical protein
MIPTTILDFVLSALSAAPKLISAGDDVLAMVQHTRASVALMQAENRGPSGAEWAALDATIDDLMNQLKD